MGYNRDRNWNGNRILYYNYEAYWLLALSYYELSANQANILQ